MSVVCETGTLIFRLVIVVAPFIVIALA